MKLVSGPNKALNLHSKLSLPRLGEAVMRLLSLTRVYGIVYGDHNKR